MEFFFLLSDWSLVDMTCKTVKKSLLLWRVQSANATEAQATADLVGRLVFLDKLSARERAVLARLEADLAMSWILTESWIIGDPQRAPAVAVAGAGFVFAPSSLSRFLMAGGGAEGADISPDGNTFPMSIFRFFLGGDFDFVDLGVSDGWADILSEVAFALLVLAFSLASSRRAFRRAWLAFYIIGKGA